MGNPRGIRATRALVVALTLAAPGIAAAQSPKDKKAASEKVKQAIAKSQAGDHQEAIDLYNEAYKIIPQPLLLSNIGSEYQQLDKPVEALSFFCKYIEADPNGSNVGYARAQAKTLYIDLGGIKDVKDEDVCKPIVKPEPEKPVPDPVGDDTNPTSTETGSTTTATTTTPTNQGPEGKSSTLRWVGVGTAVLGAGVFGLGVFYGLKAKSISDDITNHPMDQPWDSDIAQQEADGASHEKKQIYFMVGGGIALAAGVTMFFLGSKQSGGESSTGVSFTPVATPDQLGFAASGRF